MYIRQVAATLLTSINAHRTTRRQLYDAMIMPMPLKPTNETSDVDMIRIEVSLRVRCD